MRFIFAGTPEFARVALLALLQAGHHCLAVLTQPDRPSGRGMKLVPSPVKQAASGLGLPVWQPVTLRDAAVQAELAALQADVMVVAAYGQILPQAVLDLPRAGCLNIHASLLPRWRGAAPIQRAIASGDGETGISIMQMDAGLDTGAIGLLRAIPIDPDDTAGTLHDRLAVLGAAAIVEALTLLEHGRWQPQAQAGEGATYAAKISRAEAQLDLNLPAEQLQRLIRAFDPAPGAFVPHHAGPLKIWQAQCADGHGEAGRILHAGADGIVVACGDGALRITRLQVPGGKRLDAAQFLAGHPLRAGEWLVQPAAADTPASQRST